MQDLEDSITEMMTKSLTKSIKYIKKVIKNNLNLIPQEL